VALSQDPELPLTLQLNEPLWKWLLSSLATILVYAAALTLTGLADPLANLSLAHEALTLAGWGFHLLGAIFFAFAFIAIMIKKSPLFPCQGYTTSEQSQLAPRHAH